MWVGKVVLFLPNGVGFQSVVMQSVRLVVTDHHLRFRAKSFTNWFHLAGVLIILRGT